MDHLQGARSEKQQIVRAWPEYQRPLNTPGDTQTKLNELGQVETLTLQPQEP